MFKAHQRESVDLHPMSRFPAAQDLSTRLSGRKPSVLLAIADARPGFVRGIGRYAQEHRWRLVTDMLYTGTLPPGWCGDGVISSAGRRADLAAFVASSTVPVVEIGLMRLDLGRPCAAGDNVAIGRLAAEHFLERNFRHFLWVPFLDDTTNRERGAAFVDHLAESGCSCVSLPPIEGLRSHSTDAARSQHQAALSAVLCAMPKPLAVFAHNDRMAADVLDACDDAGIAVPESVAVLGVDDDVHLCESRRIPLSSVRHDLEGMAYTAASLLDRLMRGETVSPTPVRVPPLGLTVRRSTDIVAAGDVPVSLALRFIAERSTDPLLSVDEIAAGSGLSRRPLERRFRNALGRTINDEVLRVRLERAIHLLRETHASIGDVARQCGFMHVTHFHRVFRARQGLTPAAFRLGERARLAPSTVTRKT
jgi:LacI family transcriptional regulator